MKPGLYPDVPEADYHADEALSQTGAKWLLDCPARYRHRKDNPEHRDAFDFGHAAHAKVLGVGAELVVIDADDWRSKAAREARDAAHAAGKTPLLTKDARRVDDLAEAILAHPGARAILERDGDTEVSLWWTEQAQAGWDTVDVPCRGRIDRLTTLADGQPAMVDLKSTVDASPSAWMQAVARYGYDTQGAAYERGFGQVTGQSAPMVFIAVEKEPPHLVALYTLDADFRARGERRWLQAVDIFARCTATGEWPGYPADITPLSPPRWATYD